MIEEEGESRQGLSDGWSERRQLQFRVLHLKLKQQLMKVIIARAGSRLRT
jgi:hypothetical protein